MNSDTEGLSCHVPPWLWMHGEGNVVSHTLTLRAFTFHWPQQVAWPHLTSKRLESSNLIPSPEREVSQDICGES